MTNPAPFRSALALAALLAACAPAAPPPGPPAPGPQAGHEPPAAAAGANEADVRFMQGMIAHHQQALEMTALVPERAARADLRLLAERIEVSQRDEIAMMRRWLRARGRDTDEAHAGQHHHHGPGMLSPEEMARLARASGAEFDRLFLELMIRHHEGAVEMVRELFATPGGGQNTEIYLIAADVEADQEAEIARMRAMLGGAPPR